MTILRCKTIIEWRNAEHELPEKSGTYLVIHSIYSGAPLIMTMEYSSKHKAFNVSDFEEMPETALKAIYWAKCPEFPADEREDE